MRTSTWSALVASALTVFVVSCSATNAPEGRAVSGGLPAAPSRTVAQDGAFGQPLPEHLPFHGTWFDDPDYEGMWLSGAGWGRLRIEEPCAYLEYLDGLTGESFDLRGMLHLPVNHTTWDPATRELRFDGEDPMADGSIVYVGIVGGAPPHHGPCTAQDGFSVSPICPYNLTMVTAPPESFEDPC